MDFVQENNQNHDGLSCCAGATEAVLHVQPAITAKAKGSTFDQQGMIQVIDFDWFRAFPDSRTKGRNGFRAGKQSKS